MDHQILKLLTLRPYHATDDEAFIHSSWLRSFRASFGMRATPSKLYYAHQKQMIGYILSRPTTSVVIACNAEDHAQRFGWVCYETAPSHTIHYVYTKHPYREMGVANSLLINAYDAKLSQFGVTQATHETKMLKFLQTNFEMLYNPFFLWEIYANVKAREN